GEGALVAGLDPPRDVARIQRGGVQRAARSGLEQQRRALAAAAAQRRRTEPAAAAAQLVQERQRDPGAGGAERVADRDRAAVDVHDVGADTEFAHGRDADRGERLVDLDEVQVADVEAGLAERLLDRVRRLEVQAVVRPGDRAERADLGEDRGAELLGLLAAGPDPRRGALRRPPP